MYTPSAGKSFSNMLKKIKKNLRQVAEFKGPEA
jgi:hypothetical protein